MNFYTCPKREEKKISIDLNSHLYHCVCMWWATQQLIKKVSIYLKPREKKRNEETIWKLCVFLLTCEFYFFTIKRFELYFK